MDGGAAGTPWAACTRRIRARSVSRSASSIASAQRRRAPRFTCATVRRAAGRTSSICALRTGSIACGATEERMRARAERRTSPARSMRNVRRYRDRRSWFVATLRSPSDSQRENGGSSRACATPLASTHATNRIRQAMHHASGSPSTAGRIACSPTRLGRRQHGQRTRNAIGYGRPERTGSFVCVSIVERTSPNASRSISTRRCSVYENAGPASPIANRTRASSW